MSEVGGRVGEKGGGGVVRKLAHVKAFESCLYTSSTRIETSYGTGVTGFGLVVTLAAGAATLIAGVAMGDARAAATAGKATVGPARYDKASMVATAARAEAARKHHQDDVFPPVAGGGGVGAMPLALRLPSWFKSSSRTCMATCRWTPALQPTRALPTMGMLVVLSTGTRLRVICQK